jgi:hypothetical protein
MKRLALLLLLIPMIALAAIYEYKAKDGVSYYTEGIPTGLTTADKAQYKKLTQAQVDALTKAPTTLSNRDAVKAVQKKDNTVVVPPPVTCTPPQVLNTATNKCETPIVVPPVEPPVVPVSGILSLPSVAVHCNGDGEICRIPNGMIARVYFGAGGKYTVKDNLSGSVACNNSNLGNPNTGTYNRCYYVDNKLLAKNLDPKGVNLMPYVNGALTPKGSAGFSGPMIKDGTKPLADEVGAFRISCEYTHGNFDDPIVWPDMVGASHHHSYFGNVSINAYSTSANILTTGNSSCAGGTLNRSGYWMPSLIDTSNGAPVKPSVVVVYYKGWESWNNQFIQPPPKGLRMIAGNARPLSIADTQAEFNCQDQTQVMNPANWGIVWSDNHLKTCGGSNQILRQIVSFPGCWDGKNLDSTDHKSHMAFYCGENCLKSDGKIGKTFNGCPASHPVLIPNITINADFPNLKTTVKYRLSSDNYSTAYDGGYSLHADWMNGWDEAIITRVVKNCLNSPKNCGGPNLGDGQTLYGVNQD